MGSYMGTPMESQWVQDGSIHGFRMDSESIGDGFAHGCRMDACRMHASIIHGFTHGFTLDLQWVRKMRCALAQLQKSC